MALSSRDKRELLRRILESERADARPRSYPLSWGQERVWLHHQLNADSTVHHVIAAARVEGPLDIAILSRSLNDVIKRHESLRTTFVQLERQPRQLVAPALSITLRLVDISDMPESARLAEAQRQLHEESRVLFDLARGPLVRALLVRLADADHVLVLTFHHIIIDAWSAKLFADELWRFYAAFSTSTVPVLPELLIQYGDFAAWQRAHFQSATVERDLAYWRDTLRGPLPALELPFDHARGPAASGPSGTRNFEIPTDLQTSIQNLAALEGVTPFMLLLAAYQALLSIYSDQADIVVGCPVAGRHQPETESLIGFFVSIVLVRTDLGGNPTFRELLHRVRQTCLGAYSREELPIEMLLDGLEWRRDGARGTRSPVHALFNMVDEPATESWRRMGLTITLMESWPDQTDLDLNLQLRRRGGEFAGTLIYRKDLFEAATIDQLIADFLALLGAAVADCTRPLTELGVSEEARRRLRLKRYHAHRAASLDRLDDIERLSNLTQRQLFTWAGHKLWPTVPIYNLAAILFIDGAVDRPCFAQAFQTLVNSSDALRTVIEERDGIPWQRALPPGPYTPGYHDFAARPDPAAALDAWVTERTRRPFELAKPLFEAALIKLGVAKYACAFVQDHIVTDGWSIWLMFQQLATLYEQALVGDLPPHVSLPQYGAWLEHERAYRSSARHTRDREHWAAKLTERPDSLVFYGVSARKASTRVDRLSCPLGVERSQRLHAMATAQAAASGGRHPFVFSMFAAALCAFLHQVAGVHRVVLVTEVHNRRTRSFKETLGLFVEMMPLCVDIDDKMTLDALAACLRSEMLTGLRHAQHAVSHAVHRAEVALNYHTVANETHRKLGGAAVHTSVVHTGHQEETLGIRVLDFENSGNFTLDFDLHCDVFPEERRPVVVQHFLRVLDQLLDDPTRPIARISVLTPTERDRLLIDFNRTELDFPLERTFADLFEAQVERTPDRTAAVGAGRELTYRELDGRANALAHRLQALGVGPDVLVGVYLDRTVDALISLLAVTKAGGAWVPLDPAYPTERLERILADCRAAVLIGRRTLLDRLSKVAAHVIHLNADEEHDFAARPPARATGPRDLAYVLYTSGSTGTPKGAMIEQRGMLNHLLAKIQALELSATDAVAQTASLAFDISVWQCFAVLLVGGRVHVIPDSLAHDQRRLPAAVETNGISVLEVVPSLLRAMNEELARAGANRPPLRTLRWLIATGEELPPALCHQWLAMYPSIPLINAYGPTECSDDVTHHVVRTPPPPGLSRIPIGRPIANTRLYVVDQTLQPVPIGVAGELCVGGVGVGRGYLHDPRRTDESFVPDPFAATPGARLYRTGDQARFLVDGSLEFLGRLDQQVKIRGHRIEVGEIESAITRHPAVSGCVVVPRTYGEDLRLVAYVVPAAGSHIETSELRDFLISKIPAPMVPAAFVPLDALPLTPNGKVDRRALPEPAREHTRGAARFVAPRSETERRLAEIWEDAFGVRPIGVTESFFDLGGHSLMAIRMIGRIGTAFGRELPVATLLSEPTIEALARHLDLGASSASLSPLVAIQPHGPRLPLFCVHPSGGGVFDYHALARHLGKDQPFFGLEAKGLDGAAEPSTSVEELARTYIVAVRRVRPTGPYALGGHSFGGIVAFEMARQLLEDGQPVALVALMDAWRTTAAKEPTPQDRVTLLHGFGHELGVPLDRIEIAWEHFSRLPPAEQVTYALDLAIAAGVLPPEVNLAQLRRSLMLHAINIDAMRTYVARPISCPLVILRASEELSLTPSDPTLEWGHLTTGHVEVCTTPGNHFSMLREPHVQLVAERLRGYLEAATRA